MRGRLLIAPANGTSRRDDTVSNRWNIPEWLEREALAQDQCCIYCGVDFTVVASSRRDRPSWEHIVNDSRIITRANIARCCIGCNASKGTKDLGAWLESDYCKNRNITRGSLAPLARSALLRQSS